MTTPLDTKKIAQLLTASTQQLDQTTLSALANARHRALAKQPVHAPVLVANSGHWMEHSLMPHNTKQWLATGFLAVLLAIAGASFWQSQHSDEQRLSDLDVAILTDELPMDVLVD